jgi:dimethylargininase
MFKHAIMRTPGSNFAQGLTSVDLGVPDFGRMMQQYAAYCAALQTCGLALTILEPDLDHPDSTFVEDTAVLTPRSAILTRPGARSREGEVSAMAGALRNFYSTTLQIQAPGSVDGGDICEAENHFFLGLSHRTNEEGARQLAVYLEREGYSTSTIDVRGMTSILHLKSGISYIGDGTLVVIEEMTSQFSGYILLPVTKDESYAANCVRVNDRVLVPAGYPRLLTDLKEHGFDPLPLDMSEFQKMDGGLSCLSLRF